MGALLLAAALAAATPTALFLARSQTATGTYAGSVAHAGGTHGGTFLYPRFAFSPGAGRRPQTITSKSGSTDQPYADGAQVQVRYDAQHPEHAVVVSFWSLWVGPLVLAVMGSGFIGAALLARSGRAHTRP